MTTGSTTGSTTVLFEPVAEVVDTPPTLRASHWVDVRTSLPLRMESSAHKIARSFMQPFTAKKAEESMLGPRVVGSELGPKPLDSDLPRTPSMHMQGSLRTHMKVLQ